MATEALELQVRSEGSGAARPRSGAPRWVLPLILGVAAALRLVLLGSIVGRLDGDEAASGIAGRLILDGRYPLYFPDPYAYFGALEQYLQAPLLALDRTSPYLLRIPQVVLSVLSCWLVARLARQVLRAPWTGELAAALFAVGPFFSLAWSFKTRTYAMALFLGLAGLVLALGTDPWARRAPLRAAGFGLVCGLAFWTNWTSAFLLLPAGVWWLGATRGRRLRLFGMALVGFAVGAAPFAIAAQSGRLPTIFDRGIRDSSIAERVQALFGSVLGMFIGVRRPPPAAGNQPIFPEPIAFVVVAVAVVAIVAVALLRWRTMLRLVTFRPGAEPADVLLLAALLMPPMYVVSSFAFLTEEPRYLFVVYGLLPVALAALVPWRRGAVAVVVEVVLVALMALSTADGVRVTYSNDGLGPNTRLSRVQSEDLPAVVDALEQEGVREVWGGYWLAHPLAFVADHRVTAGSWEAPRFQEDFDAVMASANPAYAAPTGVDADELAAALTAAGATFRTRQVESVTLFLDITPAVQPTRIGVAATDLGLAPRTAGR